MQKRLRHRSAISTAVAAIAALAVVTTVSYTAIAMLLPRMLTAAYSTTGRVSQAEKDIAVRLSTVYHIPPTLVVSNDGTTPVRITKIYLESSQHPANILINPGERASLNVGSAQKVAVEVEGWGIVVLQTVNTSAGSPPSPPGGPDGRGGFPFRRCFQEPDGIFTCESF
jgi:hypothetical protein